MNLAGVRLVVANTHFQEILEQKIKQTRKLTPSLTPHYFHCFGRNRQLLIY